MVTRLTKPLILLGILVPVSLGAFFVMRSGPSGESDPFDYSWGRAISVQVVPEGLAGIRASDCGVCHKAIYAEWRTSTHARAMVDLQFQFEWAKDDSLWLCLNCHIPLANQQTFLVTGVRDGDLRRPVTEDNPSYDAALAEEGITCAVCHVRDGAIIGLHGAAESPHPVKVDAGALTFELCLTCHNAIGHFGGTLVCNFDTGDDWRRTGRVASGEDCLHCHMPPVTRPLAHGGAAREGRHHTWYGAGIPKLFEDMAEVPPRSGLEIEIVEDPGGYLAGEPGSITIHVANRNAGHSVPTGDVERFVLIRLRLEEENENRVYWEHEERIGEVWEWSPEPRQVSDNTLAFGEERSYRYEIDIPDGTSSLVFQVIVENHRMTEKNATEMGLVGSYPLKREVLKKSIALKSRSEL